jgi:hypothetical protein
MWPTGPLLFRLPDSFQTSEDQHLFEVHCTRCGWKATFTVAGAQPEMILQEVRAHRCPQPAARRCGRCGVKGNEGRASCPNCGEWLLPE